MADFNTTGKKHRGDYKEFDLKFNEGYVWTELFETIVHERMAHDYNYRVDPHLYRQIAENEGNNRVFSTDNITFDNMLKGHIVEVEFKRDKYEEKDFYALAKAVIRLPAKDDEDELAVVCRFMDNPRYMNVKTGWLNKKNDAHDTLDTRKLDCAINNIFGYYEKSGESKAWEFRDGSITRLEDNKTISLEVYENIKTQEKLEQQRREREYKEKSEPIEKKIERYQKTMKQAHDARDKRAEYKAMMKVKELEERVEGLRDEILNPEKIKEMQQARIAEAQARAAERYAGRPWANSRGGQQNLQNQQNPQTGANRAEGTRAEAARVEGTRAEEQKKPGSNRTEKKTKKQLREEQRAKGKYKYSGKSRGEERI